MLGPIVIPLMHHLYQLMYALVYLRLVGVCDCFHKVKVKAVGDRICRS